MAQDRKKDPLGRRNLFAVAGDTLKLQDTPVRRAYSDVATLYQHSGWPLPASKRCYL